MHHFLDFVQNVFETDNVLDILSGFSSSNYPLQAENDIFQDINLSHEGRVNDSNIDKVNIEGQENNSNNDNFCRLQCAPLE